MYVCISIYVYTVYAYVVQYYYNIVELTYRSNVVNKSQRTPVFCFVYEFRTQHSARCGSADPCKTNAGGS